MGVVICFEGLRFAAGALEDSAGLLFADTVKREEYAAALGRGFPRRPEGGSGGG